MYIIALDDCITLLDGVEMETNKSEVARLRQHIEAEYTAAQRGLQSYAVVSRHDFITARMERINEYREQLVELVGDQEAIKVVCDIAQTCGDEINPAVLQ